MLDIINTLAQFGKLCEAAKDLPRLPRETLALEEETTGEDEGEEEITGDISRTISDASFEEGTVCVVLRFWFLLCFLLCDEQICLTGYCQVDRYPRRREQSFWQCLDH